jgi:hypothetical protein
MKISFYNKNIFDEIQNYNENLNFSFRINEVLVSVIADNEFKSKKLRNYERKELLLLEMNQLFLEVTWEKNVGLLGKDSMNTKLTLNNLNLYNQSNDNIKFINAFNNSSSPSLILLNSIYHFKNDNIWKIILFDVKLGDFILNIDPIFIDEIIDFISNITYRMKIKNYNVNKIFLIEDNYKNSSKNLNVYQDKIKEYIELYNKKGLLFHGENLELPKLSLTIQISKNGLNNLLINKFRCSTFYAWAAKGLADQKLSIYLPTKTIGSYIGEFKGIFKLLLQRYKNSIKSEFVQIGIKGFFGNITKIIGDNNVRKKILDIINKHGNIFGINPNKDMTQTSNYNEIIDDKDEIYDEKTYKRKRRQRAFYEKFKYFKEFNDDDAYYFDMIPKKIGNFGIQFIFTNLVKGSINNIYIFTNSALLMMSSNFEVYNTIYYFCIDKVNWRGNSIVINYNQNIDGMNCCEFKVENEKVANRVCNILIEETAKNKDNFNDI